ncbi:MAG TPA: HAMP domain-containing sensor histidine kinase, partial [Myxococcota bacterium]|nr:HAMP domain-containing sensor histidine kinase [Myxococcota bacterium]
RETAASPARQPPPASAPEAEAPPSSFEALRSLNRGAQAREERSRRVLVGPAAEAGRESLALAPSAAERAAAPAPPETAKSSAQDRLAAAAPPPAGARSEAWDEGGTEGPTPSVPGWTRPTRPEPPPAARSAPRRARRGDPVPIPPPPPALVVVDPFVGRRAGNHLLLVRTVIVDGRGTRQGVVLDPSRLAVWLRDAGVGPALPPARLAFEPGGELESGGALASGAPRYRHAFAAPFEALALDLALAPLAEPPAERAARWLAWLLPATGALGLLALYRMVATRLAFARRRGQFVAAVSHELKTPLTAIRLIVEMLRDGAVDSEEKRRAYYATLTAESERLARLVDDVLEHSRLERGERALALETGALADAVQELAPALSAHAERAGAKLELTLVPGLPPVRFERDALAQVLFNLVDNARKYGRGPIALALRSEAGHVVLAVADRGPGVPPAELARIFEPFARGGDELTREAPGTGLGLALVRGLAIRMGATVTARNLPDAGFEVALAFPPAEGRSARARASGVGS